MSARSILPLRPYLVGGHIAFVATVLVIVLGLISPFLGAPQLDIAYERHRRSLMPEWISLVLQGYEGALAAILVAAYVVCVGGAVVVWLVQERGARQQIRNKRG